MPEVLDLRRAQMLRALRWSAALFIGFLLVTHQVIINGPLIEIDNINLIKCPILIVIQLFAPSND